MPVEVPSLQQEAGLFLSVVVPLLVGQGVPDAVGLATHRPRPAVTTVAAASRRIVPQAFINSADEGLVADAAATLSTHSAGPTG